MDLITDVLAAKISCTKEMRRSPSVIRMNKDFFEKLKNECDFLGHTHNNTFSTMDSFTGLKIVIDDSVETWRIDP